jgi:hypothetical protein
MFNFSKPSDSSLDELTATHIIEAVHQGRCKDSSSKFGEKNHESYRGGDLNGCGGYLRVRVSQKVRKRPLVLGTSLKQSS